MEATGVLPFVRGVDLSGNDFKLVGVGSVTPQRLVWAVGAIEGGERGLRASPS
uniref:FLII actin remodeling protein n=1 Tax=Saimiri boliviensis boliviensis TaxID=39432 RepID=A0A2K6UQH4_SAIBB